MKPPILVRIHKKKKTDPLQTRNYIINLTVPPKAKRAIKLNQDLPKGEAI